MAKITLFSQLFQKLPKDEIKKTIRELRIDKQSKDFNTWTAVGYVLDPLKVLARAAHLEQVLMVDKEVPLLWVAHLVGDEHQKNICKH